MARIVAASVSLVMMSFWLFAFPIAGLAVILIDVLVIYGLATHGVVAGPLA